MQSAFSHGWLCKFAYPLEKQTDRFRETGDVAAISVDSEGLIVPDLPAKARMVCVTPSHQFPLGTPMSLDRKLSLLRSQRISRRLALSQRARDHPASSWDTALLQKTASFRR